VPRRPPQVPQTHRLKSLSLLARCVLLRLWPVPVPDAEGSPKRLSSRATAVGCHTSPRGARIPLLCSSAAMPRTLVIPVRLMSATMPCKSAARWAASALSFATASTLPTCLPLRARAPFGLPSFTPRALAAARAVLVFSEMVRPTV
jgi:hypothetical protein